MPILFITGYVDRTIARRLAESGEVILRKPLSRTQLLETLEGLLRRRTEPPSSGGQPP